MGERIVSRLLLLALLAVGISGCSGPPASSKAPDKSGEQATDGDTGTAPGDDAAPGEDTSATTDDATANDDTDDKVAAAPADDKAKPPAEPAGPLKPERPDPLPTLAELDAQVEWENREIADTLELLRLKQEGEKPLATLAQAMDMKNDSKEANLKILSAFGRLPAQPEDVNWDGTIVRHSGMDLKSTNPLMISSVIEFDLFGLTGFGLFTTDWAMTTYGSKDSVVSWQTSKDRKYDKVVMRSDLTWSDGVPITAHDVVFSFQTIMHPDVTVPAVKTGTDQLLWVEAYDDTTLVFFHRQALATNDGNIGFPIIPKHIYEKSIPEDPTLVASEVHKKYENNPVVGGSYKYSKRIFGQEIVLARRDDYYMHDGKQVRPKPFFKEVRFKIIEDPNTALLALKTADIDESSLTPEQWTTQTANAEFYDRNTKATGTEWVYFYFGWNIEKPMFRDKRVRKALAYAYDYDEFLNKIAYGLYEQSSGPAHPTAWYATQPALPLYKQDLDKAEELLEEAGWTDTDGDGVRDKIVDGKKVKFQFTILCPQLPIRIASCTLLKENLDKIGIVCDIAPMEFTTLMDKTQKRDFQAFAGGWGAGSDPDGGSNVFMTGEQRNYGNYSNKEVDRLFLAGRKEFDKAKRAAIYQKIQKLLFEDQPYTWLYYRNGFYGFNKRLRGFNFSPRGPYNFGPGFSAIWTPAE